MSLTRLCGLTMLGLVLLGPACAARDAHFDRSELDRSDAGLLLGEFPLAKNAIIDGDTIKVSGLGSSLRLLGLDCEETFKTDTAWRAYEVGWDEYLANEQAKTSRPIKVATPLGMDAKHFAEDFFAGVTRVRLERDHPKEIRDRFNRYLVYVFVERDGEWINYAVEAVRAGMTPYFPKYGRSRRFDAEFVAAQRQAQAAKVGIWAEGTEHYQDYPIRLKWWDDRAAFIDEFDRDRADADDPSSMIALTEWDALTQLENALGREVELLAGVGDVRQGARGPKRVLLSRRQFQDFPLIFWEEQVYEQSGIDRFRGEYIRVRGVVTSYVDRRSGQRQLQIEVHDPDQVRVPDYTPPGLGPDEDEQEEDEAPAVAAPVDLAPKASTPRESKPTPAPAPIEARDPESTNTELPNPESGDPESPDLESAASPLH